MRTIKFRAWIPTDYRGNSYMFYQGDQYLQSFLKRCVFMSNDHGRDHEKYGHYELEQFTGLHDKNGKEIYGGDKIEIPSINNYDFVNGIHIVYWHNNRAGWYLKRADEVDYTDVDMNDLSLFNYANSSNLIGNIHQNPDLLPQ